MMLFDRLIQVYDEIHRLWENARVQRSVALGIFCVFCLALLGIEINRMGLMPSPLAGIVPTNHFHAINVAFTLILAVELLELVLSLSYSLSRAVGTQFEIMSLILLRDAFKELSQLPEPLDISIEPVIVFHIAISASAALIIFVCLGLFHRFRKHQEYIKDSDERMRYVRAKKMIGLLLFGLFISFGMRDVLEFLFTGKDTKFFETIYTVLIFADIALVLISQRFMPSFHAIFRNSGFVIATLIMRLALSADVPWNAVFSIFSAVYVLALVWATNYFEPDHKMPEHGH